MYELHFGPGKASLAVHLALLEIGAPHRLVRVETERGEHKVPAYLALNPNGLLPTLVVDGRPMYETAALLLLLAERHPEAGLAPDPGTPARAVYLQWMLHLSNTVQAAYGRWFHPETIAGGASIDEVKAAARARIEESFAHLDQHLRAHGPFVTGERLSVADLYATMLARWSRNIPRPATTWEAVSRLVAAVKARPTWRELYAREGLTEWP
jgi:glutathione S-transferase